MVLQLLLGAPFLLTAPMEYMLASFNMGRVFVHEWTVNWRFVPEHVFIDRRLHLLLLAAHITLLLAFATFCWLPWVTHSPHALHTCHLCAHLTMPAVQQTQGWRVAQCAHGCAGTGTHTAQAHTQWSVSSPLL